MKTTKNVILRLGFKLAVLLVVVCVAIISCSKDDSVVANPGSLAGSPPKPEMATGGRTTTSPDLQGVLVSEFNTPTIVYLFHGTCLGNCPSYSVSMTKGGDVTFYGIKNTNTTGRVNFTVDPDLAYQLVTYMVANGFFKFEDIYPIVPDLSQNITVVNWDNQSKKVVDWGMYVPLDLAQMQAYVEQQLGIARYVHKVSLAADEGAK